MDDNYLQGIGVRQESGYDMVTYIGSEITLDINMGGRDGVLFRHDLLT